MPGVTNTKYSFRQHLSEIGFLMGHSSQAVMQELLRHMGPQRYAQFQQLLAVAQSGEESQNRICDFVQDLREANLLRCLHPDVTLDTSYHLYENALPLLAPGKRLIELGCWTGGLSSFIAHNHPDCTVVGVDRVPHVLELNRAHYQLPNLRFALWDYRHDKPADLEPADILLCGLGTTNDSPPDTYTPSDPLTVRNSAGFQREKKEANRYFVHWRQAANDGTVLFTVLRMVTFGRFLAFIDAAQEAGWTAMNVRFIPCPSNKEYIPSLDFAARPSQPMSEDLALSHWMSGCIGNELFDLKFVGAYALALYRAFGEKRVLAQREQRDLSSALTREELGICGAFGYLFKQDVISDYRLEFMSLAQAEAQLGSFAEPEQPKQNQDMIVISW